MPEIFSQKTREWFSRAVGTPTRVQEMGWRAIAGGGDVLISAPTGMGKTLTAFLYWLDKLATLPRPIPDECFIIYISPLKALGNDIRENLEKPLAGLKLSGEVRTFVRTGDTAPSARAQMLKRPPHILITTPESLYLLLTSKKGRLALSTARCVIVDELHSVMNSKRGAHLMLSLERLDALCGRRLQRIALSATVKPLDVAANYISGGRGAAVISPESEKAIEIEVRLPEKDYNSLPEHSVWPAISDKAYRLSLKKRTTLAFLEGRAQSEKLAQGINAIAGSQYARTHHGCVSKEQRLEAERQLRSGELKIMCATSSMELGIDVGDIDLVLQVGAPRSVAGTLQRAGRAGHGPGRVSELIIFPKTESDCLASALVARAALEKRIETANVPRKCFDVVAQHLTAMAVACDYTVDEALAVVRGAYPTRDVTRGELCSILSMLAGDFEHERDLPVRPRILYDRIHGKVSGDNYTRMLAFSAVGTIPDRGWYTVALPDGTRLGELDEEYVFEARLGDKFLLGAFAWRITDITRDRVIVSAATPEGAQSPFWKGDLFGRPVETGLYFGALLREMNAAHHAGELPRELKKFPLTPDAIAMCAHYVETQETAIGCLADDRTIILEHFSDSAGEHQLMIHSIFGNRVNRALSMLIRARARDMTKLDVRSYDDDDGMLLYLIGTAELPDGLLQAIDPDTARDMIDALLPAEPMFSMAYRYAAARCGMVGVSGKGRQPLWVQRLRGAESLSAAVSQKEHPLVLEALRECREDMLDVGAAVDILKKLRSGEIRAFELHTDRPSPMSLPLRRQVEAELMYESPVPRRAQEISRMAEKALAPASEAVSERYARTREPENAEQLHTLLMTEGDLAANETSAPPEWFEQLAGDGRAAYVEPGLWIAAERIGEYETGISENIIRRCLRYKGAQDAASVSQRYAIPVSAARAELEALEESGAITPYEGMYVHSDIYSSAQRLTIKMRRSEVVTAPREKFAALIAESALPSGSPKAQLSASMARLLRFEAPAQSWEESILPARVSGYRPELLDNLLTEGGIAYLLRAPEGKPLVAFYAADDLDMDEFAAPEAPLEPDDEKVLAILEKTGAQFDYSISRRMNARPVSAPLERLSVMGLIKQDAFTPVRRMLHPAPRAKNASSSGRWERARAPRELSLDERISRAFDACPILCRETYTGVWRDALDKLRVMELTGEVRRGYFCEGLSGAQFVRAEDFPRVVSYLASEAQSDACLGAGDPAQVWGRYLPHAEGREFMRAPGTAVVLLGGKVCCVFERRGEVLRVFERGEEAVARFARAFRERRVFPNQPRVRVKKYPENAGAMLEACGFTREALEYVIYA